MTTNIYILKLNNDNYYVGKTKNVNKRFQEHLSGNGSSWTQMHKPIEIIKSSVPLEIDFSVWKSLSIRDSKFTIISQSKEYVVVFLVPFIMKYC